VGTTIDRTRGLEMELLKRSRRQTHHLVAEGRVGCPLTGTDVSFERCLVCPRLTDFARVDGGLEITCNSRAPIERRASAPRWVTPPVPGV
jgi:hypothetical protein